MRRIVAIAFLVLALPAPASAQIDLRLVATPDHPARGDGERYAAWSGGGTTTVTDDEGPQRSFQTTQLECADKEGYRAPQVRAVGSGRIATSLCPDDGYGPATIEIRHISSGGVRRAEDPRTHESYVTNGNSETPQVTEVGTHWVQTWTSLHHGASRTYFGWRGGGVVRDNGDGRSRLARRAFPDVDSRSLYRPLCRPLARAPNPQNSDYFIGPDLAEFHYRPPLAVTFKGRSLVLRRCGSSRARVISRCERGCVGIQLGERAVTWADFAGRGYVHVIASGRRLTIGSVRPGAETRSVAQTGERLFVNAWANRNEVYEGKLPAH